jgi:hypothetical protein
MIRGASLEWKETRMRSRALPIALALVLASAAAAAELQTAEEIDACYQANFPSDTSVQTIAMNARDRIGAVTVSRATMYFKKFDDGLSRVMMRFFKPADMRGAGLLMIEKPNRNDMFLYLPELGRVKRVTSRMTSSSMFGTDFSYEEFERIQGMAADSPLHRLEDVTVEDRPTYVIETRPTEDDDSAYERIKNFIDQEICVLVRSEFYERGDAPRKIMTSDPAKATKEGDIWITREMLMRDKRDETETTMVVEDVEVGKSISRKIFSQRELEAGS